MKEKLQIIVGLLIVGLILFFFYKVAAYMGDYLKAINPSLGAALVAGGTTIISSVFIASYNARKARERVAFEAYREKKAEVYNDFLGTILEFIRNTKKGKVGEDILPPDIEEFFLTFTSKITIYGGPKVIKAFSQWKGTIQHEQNGLKALGDIDNLFKEMRSDLGLSNKGIGKNELLGLYIIGGKTELDKISK